MPGQSSSFLVATTAAFLLLDLVSGQTGESGNRCHVTLDFEDDTQRDCLSLATNQETARISFSTSIAKHGRRSLKWESGNTTNGESRLRYVRPSNALIDRGVLLNGGIKMWIYKETTAKGRKMEVRLGNRSNQLGMFTIDMGFKGWRAIWVSYAECKNECDSLNPPARLPLVDFVLTYSDTVYFDLVEFVRRMTLQSRDKIVPPFTKFGSMYDASEYWQRSYHWSQQTPTVLPTTVDPSKTLSLTHIESRLKNWYCDETQTSYDFKGNLKARWQALTRSFTEANNEYDRLDFKEQSGETVIGGPPLFCRNCVQGTQDYSSTDPTRKFSFITTKVLLPLALEFYLKSRQNELSKTVTEETAGLNSKDIDVREKSLQKISKNKGRRDEFFAFLKSASQGSRYTEEDVRRSLEYINKVRLQRIINLLDYLEDQGWADGSGIGSLDHEMNRNGAGYMHTLFLLKDSLHQSVGNGSRLLGLIKTAKWYNDFGEVYQTSFEYNGTTADRMITIMLFRLMIVLIMPTCSEDELKARQRDMDALKRWMDNALTINKAFGGVIKPDYIGFHHKAFYASAYTPHALHTAAQVQYLLEGTDYALSEASKRNLRLALQTLRLTAVKYSTPSSVGGRVVDFSKAILIQILPAYAYISVSQPGPPLPGIPEEGINATSLNTEAAAMFQRLYQPSNAKVEKYLKAGRVQKGKTYMNSLGSLQIMCLVNSMSPSAEVSPEGHWSKNFAALSIHRRKDWAVTVKGFNRFVWDFEGSSGSGKLENVFGTFASHGSMLIASSEEALKSHDVNNGWDWRKIPGATTMSLTLRQIRVRKARNFSPLSSAGGVTFKGPDRLPSGLFGMDFHQPDYEFSARSHPYPNIKLHFKKSVFFYQNLLVCLGSNITIEGGGETNAQTTLFQDKLVRDASLFSIKVDDVTKDSSAPFEAMNPLSTNGKKNYTTLVDTKGNSYYIPGSSASNLRVHVKTQNSQTPAARPSSGVYATAWLEHTSPNGFYEYAIWINTDSYPNIADKMWARQTRETGIQRPYQIIRQDDEAHVVRFNVIPESGKYRNRSEECLIRNCSGPSELFGYVYFRSAPSLYEKGPIERVNMQCRIMAEEFPEFLYLSVSYPDLNFPFSKVIKSFSDIKVRELFKMESNEMELVVTLRGDFLKCPPEVLKVFGSPPDYVPQIRVESSAYPQADPNRGNVIIFSNLKNGVSVEVKLRRG